MSVIASRPLRPNLRSLDGGRPVSSVISRLEGRVESIIAITDDARLFESGSNHLHVLVSRLGFESQSDVVNIGHIRRLTAAMQKLSDAMIDRCHHLRDAVLPEIKRCYALDEAQA